MQIVLSLSFPQRFQFFFFLFFLFLRLFEWSNLGTVLANTKINSFSFLFPLSIPIFWATWCDILQIDCMNGNSLHLSSFECWLLQCTSTYASIECNNFFLIDSNVMVIYWSALICSSLTRHNQKLCVSFDFVTFVAVRLIDSTFQIGNSQHAVHTQPFLTKLFCQIQSMRQLCCAHINATWSLLSKQQFMKQFEPFLRETANNLFFICRW